MKIGYLLFPFDKNTNNVLHFKMFKTQFVAKVIILYFSKSCCFTLHTEQKK